MNPANSELIDQLATFTVDGEWFGVEVKKVQEVAKEPQVFRVPLAPHFVRGLVNLRGQIATAVGLREAFHKEALPPRGEQMSVVCKVDGNFVSLVVDGIGDVVEVAQADFEHVPDTVDPHVKKYLKGIYKMDGVLLSLLDLEAIGRELTPVNETGSE